MLFNSIEFAIFLPIVFFLYWFVFNKKLKFQNLFLLTASYIFYGWWDCRFLSIIVFISIFDYFVGLGLEKVLNKNTRKLLFYFAICINLGILIFFKYCNFFIGSFIELVSNFGISLHVSSLRIILPIGISFYTFLSLSYIIDVYKKKLTPTKDIVELSASLSFFPIIFAGPIHRPINLIPQFRKKREFNYNKATDGLRQILWGLFQKVIIADICAKNVNYIFSNYQTLSGNVLFLGAVFYAFQIYCDFSGYSNIAIGSARLFGIDIIRNFAYPYFARDITEFWRRWHISLTQWFRDYIFLPVSYSISRKIKAQKILNIETDIWIYAIGILITWSLVGLWHGANWTFICWGLINALFLVFYHISRNTRKKLRKKIGIKKNNKVLILLETVFTFIITTFAWIFFRSDSISKAFHYIRGMFSNSIFIISSSELKSVSSGGSLKFGFAFIIVLIIVEWIQREKQHGLQFDSTKTPRIIRWGIYYTIITLIFAFGGTQQEFIYFQF